MNRIFAELFILGALVTAQRPATADTRIVLLAGAASHGHGEHEHRAGCLLPKSCLEDVAGIIPILSAVPPASTMDRPDGPHEGNPAVRKAVKAHETQHMAWAYVRPNGGRGFGFTGGHYYKSWGNDNFRKIVLNAILWTAKL